MKISFSKGVIKIFTILSFILPSGLYAQQPHPVTLKTLIEEAVQNNPQLIKARKIYEAEKAKIPQAAALGDPWIGMEFERIPKRTVDFDDAPMRMYSVSQEIPFPTKLITRANAQKNVAEAAYQRYKEKEREVISKVKSLYSEIALVYKVFELDKENKSLLEQLASTAAARFSLGKANQQDALKAHVEIAKIDSELIMLEQKKEVLVARLNILLNRPLQQELGEPKIVEEIGQIDPIDEYCNLAKEKRPELLAVKSEINKTREMYSLAIQEYLPDFNFELKQREEDGRLDGWDAMVKAKVPFWFLQKQNFQVKQMKKELEAAETEFKNMENMTLLEVKEAHSMAASLIKLVALYKTSFMPQAEQALKASLTGYETGEVDFLNLLDSQRMLLDFKLDYYNVLVKLETAKADLERAVGIDLF